MSTGSTDATLPNAFGPLVWLAVSQPFGLTFGDAPEMNFTPEGIGDAMKNVFYGALFVAGLALVTMFAPAGVDSAEAAARRSRTVEVKVSKPARAYAVDCAAEFASDCDASAARKGIWPGRVKTRTRSRSRGESNCAGELELNCAGASKPSKEIFVPRPSVRVEVKVLPPEP